MCCCFFLVSRGLCAVFVSEPELFTCIKYPCSRCRCSIPIIIISHKRYFRCGLLESWLHICDCPSLRSFLLIYFLSIFFRTAVKASHRYKEVLSAMPDTMKSSSQLTAVNKLIPLSREKYSITLRRSSELAAKYISVKKGIEKGCLTIGSDVY